MLRIVGSLRFAAVILVLLCIAMACATVFEATHGTPAALQVFYKSDWFKLLLGLLGFNVLASMLSRLPWSRRHVGFLITHASILIILLGAWVTEHWGINGQVAITEGQSARQFTTDRHAIVVRKDDQETFDSEPLGRGIGGREAIARYSSSPIRIGEMTVEVQSYVPDSEWTQRVVDDNPEPSLALEISLASQGQTSKEWIFADGRQRSNVAVRAVKTPAELDQILATPATQPAPAARTVKVELNGKSFAFPLEQCMAGPVAIGDTGYTLKVLRYLPHAMVGENRQLTNASERPVNPAIEAEIAGPEGATKRMAFARFPDFGSMHGGQTPAAEAKLSLDVPADEQSASLIEVAGGPDGRMVARFNPANAAAVTREIQLNQAVETPWPGLTLLVARRFDRARRESILEPVEDPRENRVPAISVVARSGEQSRELWLRRQEPQRVEMGSARYELTYGSEILPLGFEIRLNKFHLGTYPGTGRPRSFESHVTFIDGAGNEEPRKISMNNPAVFGSYSLFQSSYEQPRSGPNTTILSVSWDPGLKIVFGGYVTLVLGMIYVLVTRMRSRKHTEKDKNGTGQAEGPAQSAAPGEKGRTGRAPTHTARAGGLAAAALAVVLASQPVKAVAQSAKLPGKVDVGVIRGLPVQHDGRWMPLDTVALDMVRGITGSKYYQGQDAVRWLLAWTFEPATWQEQPLITISSAELRRELQLPEQRSVFSFGDLVRHKPLMDQIDHLSHRSGRGKMNPLESKVTDINEKLTAIDRIFRNQVIRPIPNASSVNGAWQPVTVDPAQAASFTPMQTAWSNLGKAFLADDAAGFAQAAAALTSAQKELPAAHRPAAKRLATELRYNRIRPYTTAWRLMALGAVLSAAALFVKRRWFDAIAILGLMAGFASLSYGMSLRWQIAGRIPASNMFESLLFLSWGAGAFAIVAMLFLKDRSVPLTASAIGALALFLADTLPIDQFIRPIAPVLLDTVWMSIHVPGIMVSYAVLALAALIAHVQMIAMAVAPRRQRLIDRIDAMHYWYMHVGVILLGAGIITGSMWAAFSWGRYWGWDPKEVWSLIAFLAYLVIMHVRVDRERVPAWTYGLAFLLGMGLLVIVGSKLAPFTWVSGVALASGTALCILFVVVRGQFASAFKSAVAFWFIIMTYVGVNYVLGIGLHSYGFGTGAVVHYMMLIGGLNLAGIAVLTIIYLARTQWAVDSSGPTLARQTHGVIPD